MPPVEPAPRVLSPDRFGLSPEGALPRLGLIVLATDLTSERDAAALIPPARAAVHVSRVAYDNPTTPDNLLKMAPRLGDAARVLVPGAALRAVYYSCTSGSVVIGDDVIRSAIGAWHPGVPVVTPTGAALAAFEALGVRRIALVTPYLAETLKPMIAYFSGHGIEVASALCFGFADDRDMARIRGEDIAAAASEADCPEAEAVFLSCTALPALGVIAELEARLGKPVVSSNQAGFWALRHHAGLSGAPEGFGGLMSLPLPDAAEAPA